LISPAREGCEETAGVVRIREEEAEEQLHR
jgi:hypothetical protein